MSAEKKFGPEAAAAFVVFVSVLIFFAPIWLSGQSPFWRDLTYLHQAWRAAPAQIIQAGRAPLWEPSLYLGMPMAGAMQGGLFYPPTLVYFFFGFAGATAIFQSLHLFLAGWLAILWLRSLRLCWGPCVGGGLCLAFGGLMISRIPFLNHLAVLSWMPALVLFFRRPGALAIVLSLMFLAGYPTFIPGAAAAAWAVAFALRARRAPGPAAWSADWTFAAGLASALCAAQLFPALELAFFSRRFGGVNFDEATRWGFSFFDLRQWISPLFVPLRSYRPEIEWWKCVYLGATACFVAGLGVLRAPRRRALILAATLICVAVLIMGASNPISAIVWARFTPLHFVRYPGNLAYIALLPTTVFVAAGFSRVARAPVLVGAAILELMIFGWISTPVTSRRIFTEPGPLVRKLQSRLDGRRYLISPRALEASHGDSVADWKTRLYGLTNAPYRLRALANFGEPLVPTENYAFMDRILGVGGAEEAARWMPWAGAPLLLTPRPISVPGLVPEDKILWNISRTVAPSSMAYLFSIRAGAALPIGIPAEPPALGKPMAVAREREDRFSISGQGPGWAYVAEPRYPGWRTELETPRGGGEVAALPAMGPFQKIPVPDGPWVLRFQYDPASWRWGVLASLTALLAVASYWYHRTSRFSHVAE